MNRSRIALLALPLVAAALTLSACGPSDPSPDPTVAEPTPSDSATATPDPEPAGPVFALPANCGAIASQITLNQVFSGIDARDPADLVRPAPASASKLLTCSWFTGDTTGGDLIYYSAPAADSAAYLDVVKASGFACTEAFEGTRCDKTTPNSQFPVDTVETVFTRDDVWIYISMTNVDAAPLLPDMVATAWAA
ncbi:MAG: hypothetical protein ABI566_11950 [Pseudolysinimonas sp.]